MHCLFYRLSSGTRAARLHTYAWKCVSNWVPIITIAGTIQDHLSDTAGFCRELNVFDWESWESANTSVISVIRSVSLGRWSFEELRQIYHDLPTFRQMYVIRKDWWSNGNYEGRFCHEASPFGHADANADHEGSNHIATRFLGCCFFMFFLHGRQRLCKGPVLWFCYIWTVCVELKPQEVATSSVLVMICSELTFHTFISKPANTVDFCHWTVIFLFCERDCTSCVNSVWSVCVRVSIPRSIAFGPSWSLSNPSSLLRLGADVGMCIYLRTTSCQAFKAFKQSLHSGS